MKSTHRKLAKQTQSATNTKGSSEVNEVARPGKESASEMDGPGMARAVGTDDGANPNPKGGAGSDPVAGAIAAKASAIPPATGSRARKQAKKDKPAFRVPLEVVDNLDVTGTTVSGICTGMSGKEVGLMLDSELLDTAMVGPDGELLLSLPARRFAGSIDILDLGSGSSLLRTPVDLAAFRVLQWHQWTCIDGQIEGSFTIAGDGTQGGVAIVQSFALGRLAFRAAAHQGEAGVYRFSGQIRLVLPPRASITLRPQVNGVELDQPLDVNPDSIGVSGHLDFNEAAVGRGWATNLSKPQRRVGIEFRVNGGKAGQTMASLLREDLRELGLGDGKSGFAMPFPRDLDRRQPITIQAFIADTVMELSGSPYTLPALPPIVGFFDGFDGPFVSGWAINVYDLASPLTIEAVCDGEVVGTSLANLPRYDVEGAGMPTALCGFRFRFDKPVFAMFDRDISLRVKGTGLVLNGSPRRFTQNKNLVRFLTRSSEIRPKVLSRLTRRMTYLTRETIVSIVMPVYNTKREWLLEALASVHGQWSANWELICVDDGSSAPHVGEILAAAARHDRRIRVMRSSGNLGIAAAVNFGLRAARGQLVAFMDHDDVIEPDAVYKLASAAQQTGADLIYSDEAVTSEDINSVIEVRARPAFSHDFYLSHPYFVHLVAVRTDMAQRLAGWDESLPISADIDFVLRAIEASRLIAHIPSVLYRWRTHETSTGHQKQKQVTNTMVDVLSRHLQRLGKNATVRPGFRFNEYRVDWPDDGGEVLIVIPTKDRIDLLKPCIDSIEATAKDANYRILVIDHQSTDSKTVAYLAKIGSRHTVMRYQGVFNYAAMNNLAVKLHGGDSRYVVLLNNDVKAFEKGWLQRLRSLAGRPEVGAVGPLLIYGDRRVQHAGVLMAFSGTADHAMKFQEAYISKDNRHPGYNCNLTTVRDYSAVTAACIIMRMDVFNEVGGFDEQFVVGFNDTDLCLRIVAAGYKVLYDGFTVLYHLESASRSASKSVYHPEDDERLRKRWKSYFEKGDPFYNPLLSPRGTDHMLRNDSACKSGASVRTVDLVRGKTPTVRLPMRRKTRIVRKEETVV